MRAQRAAVRQLPLFASRVPGVTMQTTGLTRERMSELYEANRLASALHDARRRTLAFYSHLDLAQLRVPYVTIINPPLWELAHVAWFQEFWCLRYRPDDPTGSRTPPLLEGADALFDSRSVAHETRWNLPLPPVEAIFAYLERTLARTLEALEEATDERRYFGELVVRHEDMHGEALLMTLQTLALPAPAFAPSDVPPSRGERPREVLFEGGEFLQGTLPETREFVFDNEKWAHMASMRPFTLSMDTVTQGEFVAFVEEGGYRRPDLWSEEGWKWREEARMEAPRYWRREERRWHLRRFDRWVPVEIAAPMVHVSLHEALAFCRWAERRLPTEAEWEFAARNGGRADRFPWGDSLPQRTQTLDGAYLAPSTGLDDPAPSKTGLRQMIGGVWEWTSSAFLPYPGFRADPYKEYSKPWFGSHHVLRGGSFATRSRLVHNRFRNFYLPERADVFAGFRTCAIEP
jgi:iron(II)-dependent oxidoreductase